MTIATIFCKISPAVSIYRNTKIISIRRVLFIVVCMASYTIFMRYDNLAVANQKRVGDKRGYYHSFGETDCEASHITVSSTCFTEGNAAVPLCYAQEIQIYNQNVGKTFTISYIHKWRDGSPDFMTSVVCKKIKQGDFIVVNGTNFASCSACEWLDVFNYNGDYIGSSMSSDWHDRPMPFRKISPKLAEDLAYGNSNPEDSKIEIDRNYKEGD